MRWCIHIIPLLRRLRLGNPEFQLSLSYLGTLQKHKNEGGGERVKRKIIGRNEERREKGEGGGGNKLRFLPYDFSGLSVPYIILGRV